MCPDGSPPWAFGGRVKFTLFTLYPQMIHQAFDVGVVGQALKKGIFQLSTVNPRAWATGVHKAVDDRPFGGGDGMIMSPEVLHRSLKETLHGSTSHVIYMSPQGKTLNEKKCIELADCEHVVILSGRYGGIDQRLLNEWVDEEISIGDYVLSGGEVPALVLIDAVARKIPGVLGHQESSSRDSFARGLLEEPQFTRPWIWEGKPVPDILKSGHHEKINEWKMRMALLVTAHKRPDLLKDVPRKEIEETKKFLASLSAEEKHICGLPEGEDFFG